MAAAAVAQSASATTIQNHARRLQAKKTVEETRRLREISVNEDGHYSDDYDQDDEEAVSDAASLDGASGSLHEIDEEVQGEDCDDVWAGSPGQAMRQPNRKHKRIEKGELLLKRNAGCL